MPLTIFQSTSLPMANAAAAQYEMLHYSAIIVPAWHRVRTIQPTARCAYTAVSASLLVASLSMSPTLPMVLSASLALSLLASLKYEYVKILALMLFLVLTVPLQCLDVHASKRVHHCVNMHASIQTATTTKRSIFFMDFKRACVINEI